MLVSNKCIHLSSNFNFKITLLKQEFIKMKKIVMVVFCIAALLTSCNTHSQTEKKSNSNKTKEEMSSKVKETTHYVHSHGMPFKGKILMVASSPTVSKQTGWPIGFWAAELTHPLHVFQEAGYEVEIVSTEGGKIVMDGYSNPTDESGYSAHDVISLGYMQQEWFNQMLDNTQKLTDVNASDYDAIFLVGGQGPMYTFKGNEDLQKLFATFYEAGKPSAAVCHSATLLLEAKKSNGELIVNNKTWTGFANLEEDFADQAVGMKIQPYRIEDEAKKIENTTFKVATPFASYAIEDGNLITGQQQNSGAAAARLVVEQLSK